MRTPPPVVLDLGAVNPNRRELIGFEGGERFGSSVAIWKINVMITFKLQTMALMEALGIIAEYECDFKCSGRTCKSDASASVNPPPLSITVNAWFRLIAVMIIVVEKMVIIRIFWGLDNVVLHTKRMGAKMTMASPTTSANIMNIKNGVEISKIVNWSLVNCMIAILVGKTHIE
jgi:hypothetical protein